MVRADPLLTRQKYFSHLGISGLLCKKIQNTALFKVMACFYWITALKPKKISMVLTFDLSKEISYLATIQCDFLSSVLYCSKLDFIQFSSKVTGIELNIQSSYIAWRIANTAYPNGELTILGWTGFLQGKHAWMFD